MGLSSLSSVRQLTTGGFLDDDDLSNGIQHSSYLLPTHHSPTSYPFLVKESPNQKLSSISVIVFKREMDSNQPALAVKRDDDILTSHRTGKVSFRSRLTPHSLAHCFAAAPLRHTCARKREPGSQDGLRITCVRSLRFRTDTIRIHTYTHTNHNTKSSVVGKVVLVGRQEGES